jgi:hypothetical protein
MLVRRDARFERSARIVLGLYAGAFLSQALCVLHSSHMESGIQGPALHTLSSMATHESPSPASQARFSMMAHNSSEHDGHSDGTAQTDSGACAVLACAAAITASPDHGLGPMNRVSSDSVAHLGDTGLPDAEMVPPPPRLG